MNIMQHLSAASLKRKVYHMAVAFTAIVPDSATSESTIISTGHPNGAEPLCLAVPSSVQ